MKHKLLAVFLFALAFLSGCTIPVVEEVSEDHSSSYTASAETLTVHFIDVDQGDSEFIELPNGETMLIDAGESDQGDKVVDYIFSQGYGSIDYVVASHLHSDHIGGLPDIFNNFKVGNFYTTEDTAATKVYNNLIDSVTLNGAKTYTVQAGDMILDDDNLQVSVVGPVTLDSDDKNNNSIVLKVAYGNTSFLFTGDAEKQEEDSIRANIKCDVLKVGHHGSSSSTSKNFLKKVEPKYAVISCGLNNKYGHPTQSVVDRLEQNHIQIYRTDNQGTIVIKSDGAKVIVP